MDYYNQPQRFEPYIRNKRELQLPFLTCEYSKTEERDKVLPSIKDINKTSFSQLDNALAFVIRSNNDDDIHKSLKYGIWASGKENNDKLNEAFKQAQDKGLQVFLFYSVVKSGQFVGVARLLSGYNEESFPYWWQSKKWKGHFKVQWVQAKDVTNKNFEALKNTDQVEVTRSRDGAQLEWASAGQPMMKVYEQADGSNSILNDFQMLDEREKSLRDYKTTNPNTARFSPPSYQPSYQPYYQPPQFQSPVYKYKQ